MLKAPHLPILGELIGGGLEYGTNLLVEFEPHSLWYETSLTIAVNALKNGTKTEYHVHQHLPDDIRQGFRRLGLNAKKLEDEGLLRIFDSYTSQTGLGPGEEGPGPVGSGWLNLTERRKMAIQHIKEGYGDVDKRWLHIDDNTSVLLEYNTEKEVIDEWRITMPWLKARQVVLVTSLLTDAASPGFYRKIEALCDAIIDFRAWEQSGRMNHFVRLRVARGRQHDSRWRRLELLSIGEVRLVGEHLSREFKFRSSAGSLVFDSLVDAFIEDYMTRRYHLERAGWRSLVDIARKTKVPLRTLYGEKGGLGLSIGELVERGLVESRVFPGERGRGGEVTRVRLAYDRDPVKEYVDETLRTKA